MISRTVKTLNISVILTVVIALILAVALCYGDLLTMTMSPHKIILNSECDGAQQDIQAIIGRPLGEDEDVDYLGATLYFDGDMVSKTTTIRYCYIDYNFLIAFDRDDIHAFYADKDVPSGMVDAIVEVYYVDSPDGILFSGIDSVEILAPGNKAEKK